METLIIKATYKGNHSHFIKGKTYTIILTKIKNGWDLKTHPDHTIGCQYNSLKEFIEEWSDFENY